MYESFLRIIVVEGDDSGENIVAGPIPVVGTTVINSVQPFFLEITHPSIKLTFFLCHVSYQSLCSVNDMFVREENGGKWFAIACWFCVFSALEIHILTFVLFSFFLDCRHIGDGE